MAPLSPLERAVAPPLRAGTPLSRLLTLAGEELDADVRVLPPHAEPSPPTSGRLVRLRSSDGGLRGWLQILPHQRRSRLAPGSEQLVRTVARFLDAELGEEFGETVDGATGQDRIRSVLDRGGPSVVFQPIVDLSSGAVVGVEALSRFADPPGRPPDQWFAEAAAVGLGVPLEVLAVREAVQALDELPAPVYLSVNVSPAAAASPELAEALAGTAVDRLVLEITEHAAVEDYEALNSGVGRLRARGARLAVDDTGSGFASMRHVLRLAPDVVKLDTTLTSDIDSDSLLRALGFSLTSFTAAINAQVIAEGIETGRELDALRFLGVTLGQGYYLRPPGPLSLDPPNSLHAHLEEDTAASVTRIPRDAVPAPESRAASAGPGLGHR